jgi:hypothetical protein
VARRPRLLAGLLAAVAVLYGLRLGDVLDNWSWVVLTVLVVVAAPALARLPRSRPEEPRPTLEWLGLDGPYRPEDIAELDRALGLPKVAHGAP